MTAWLLSLFTGGGIGGVLGTILAGIVGLLAVFFAGKSSGKAKEQAKQQKARGDAYEQSLKELGDAAAAGRSKLPDVANDKYNRDNQGR